MSMQQRLTDSLSPPLLRLILFASRARPSATTV
jgi:hypothetical protein